MATIKSEYYRFNGTAWDLHYFKTSADLIVETATYKVLTATERTSIADYLASFNVANKLVKLDGSAKIPSALIPSLGYLPLTGGTLTGQLVLTNSLVVGGASYFNGEITSDNGTINMGTDVLSFTGDGAYITNVKTPVAGNQAATKEYVDNLVAAGFKVKEPVKAASIGNIDIAVALNNLDGCTLYANDRVLLKNQTTTTQNGVYQLNASKIPVKVTADSTIGNSVFVEYGDTYNDNIFVSSVVNTWSVFARPDTVVAGNGLVRSGNTIAINTSGVTNAMLAGSIEISKLANFSSSDALPSFSLLEDANVSKSLASHLEDLYCAIARTRGQSKYNEAVTSQTVAGAYNLINTKNKTEIGASVPGTTGYTTGDLFFKTVA